MPVLSKRNFFILILLGVSFFCARYFIFPMFEQKERAQVIVTQHRDFVIATGSIGARDDVTLTFEEGGVVQKLHYRSGDSVEAGSVIASLNAGTVQAEVDAQRSRLEKEVVRLEGFVSGPEEYERVRVGADIGVFERKLEREVGVALSSAQRMAASLEDMFRSDVDSLFSGTPDDPRFEVNIPVVSRQRVNKARQEIEAVFLRWRMWANTSDTHYGRVSGILKQFERDLRLLHDHVTELYDLLLASRSADREVEEAFLLIAKLRSVVIDSVVEIIRLVNAAAVTEAEYQLALARGNEALSGSTQSDRLAQSAQVTTEREKLRRLELQLAKTQIRAPFSGIVGEVLVEVGEFVPPGTESVRFVSRDGFDLLVNVTEVEVPYVSPDQEMQAKISATGDEIPVRVRTVDATEKRVNDVPVYTVVFDVVDAEVPLRPGMTVDVYIPSGDPVDVFIVPQDAVIRRNGDYFVSVERGGEAVLVPVVIGSTGDDGTVTVTGDLHGSDFVILDPSA